jgi:thioredoxin-dependent peroxiredoxin
MSELAEGDTVPPIDLPLDDSGAFRSADHAGRPFVLFFYPKDDTSGCTIEAQDFSRLAPDFAALGVGLVGISPDSLKSHAKFREKQELTVPLAADVERNAIEAFGVWKEKSMYGRKYMGVERSTFLIGGDGRIAKAWRQVSVPGHAQEVLDAARALASAGTGGAA